MNKKLLKKLYRFLISLTVVFSVCELVNMPQNVSESVKTASAAKAQQGQEAEQYIPQNLNYAKMIQDIKREEGVPEEELKSPTISEDLREERINLSLSPRETLQVAKRCVQEAMEQPSEAKIRLKVRQALLYYKEFLKYYPENLDGLLGAGAMATYLGREDEARNILMQAYATYPTNPNVHKALGDYSFRFSNYNNAIEYYNLSLNSGNLKDYATNLSTALCYEKLGEVERAKEYFKFAQHLNPESEIANQRVKMYEQMEHEGYSADPRVYDEATKPNEENDLELETLILDAQQLK
ncbi:MAG: hypothetical protein K6C94_04310 [Candidatus Gastranaerophilales bacterium]|nr:hypothetical protein [Candidatus Gastranaerophilales bacterium]